MAGLAIAALIATGVASTNNARAQDPNAPINLIPGMTEANPLPGSSLQRSLEANPLPEPSPQPAPEINAFAPDSEPVSARSIFDPVSNTDEDSGFAMGVESAPQIDPLETAAEARIPLIHASMRHGQCEGGWGPKPRKVSAMNITPGDPYYIEIRMRHTPLLPVGHTYVAYGRLDPAGNILDEKLIMLAPVGGYAGAALASGIPMPGILDPHPDDCRIRPQTAYRVSLNARRYEKLLLEIRDARQEKPSYLLFHYNCNHFMTRIAGSVGIRPPKNIYVPALEYIYAMIEENEGRKVSRW